METEVGHAQVSGTSRNPVYFILGSWPSGGQLVSANTYFDDWVINLSGTFPLGGGNITAGLWQTFETNTLNNANLAALDGYSFGSGNNESCANFGGGASASHDWNYESNGWPCLDQIGRGLINGCSGANCSLTTPQDSVPFLMWNNGPQCSCSGKTYPVSGIDCTSGSCDNSIGVVVNPAGGTMIGTMADYIKTTVHVNGDKDYCVIPNGTDPNGFQCGNYTNAYMPYTYPHPLQGITDNVAPAAPSGLSLN